MRTSPRVIERLIHTAPLGLRFWDEVSGRLIGQGLTVTAYRPASPTRQATAILNHVNVFVFWKLPGLPAVEARSGDAGFEPGFAPQHLVMIEVEDRERRFIPFTFPVKLPLPGLLPWECFETSPLASPPAPGTMIPLYSSPNRAAPAGMAVIRAQLWDWPRYRPAAWAVLEAGLTDGPVSRGLADDQGRVAVIFPYPEPQQEVIGSPVGSPLGAGRCPLFAQTWPIQLRARYEPEAAPPPKPDLCHALTQTPATLWQSLSPAVPLTHATLEYGRELVLKSEGKSFLFITAADSPPS